MNLKFLLGVATGVGIAYFFTSQKGKGWIEATGQRISDGLNKGEDILLDATDGLENVRRKVVENTKQSSLV